jgi:hypothetical protein
MCAGVRFVVFGALLSLTASVARGQRSPDAPVRLAVIGQTDSTGLALAARVRTGLADVARRGSTVIVPTRDIALIVEQAYRGPADPIMLHDIGEVAKLVRADIVLALVPDTVRVGNIEAIIFRSRTVNFRALPVGARTLGSWPAARIEQSSMAILRAFEADSLYRHLFER